MLKRDEGATLSQIIEATGWQPHTVRGAISGALKKKLGLSIVSRKLDDGERLYRIEAESAMPTFQVIITRDVTESTVIEVDAETKEQAEEAAFEKLLASEDTEWCLDDGSWNNGDAYVTAVDPINNA